jgi:dihydroflavonol-4-reductase
VKVAVTGGSGIVGSALLERAVAGGHDVRALARSPQAVAKVEGRGAEPVPGDILDLEALRRLVAGADWVFHVAGVNEMCPRDPAAMDRVNVVGTGNVVEACRAAGVGRLIHTSSAVAIGESQGSVGSEDSTHRGRYLSRYERSKHLSEEVALGAGPGLEVVVVCPSSVQGPGRATGTGKLILDVLRGKIPFLVDTTVSVVDIDDCAEGHLLAAGVGEPGRRYLLNGASLRLDEAIDLITKVTGIDVARRYLPGSVVSALAWLVDGGARLARRHSPLCPEMARVLRHGHRYDGSRATRELGLSYRPIEDTMRRTVDWFQAEGLLDAPR